MFTKLVVPLEEANVSPLKILLFIYEDTSVKVCLLPRVDLPMQVIAPSPRPRNLLSASMNLPLLGIS